jgi:hypothetical protein
MESIIVITKHDIEIAYKKLQGTCGGVPEDYFGLLYLEKEHDVPQEKAINQIAFGGNDYGIDGFHFDKVNRNLYLFQFKFSPSPGQFKASMQRLIEAGMEMVFATPNKDQGKNPILIQLRSCLQEHKLSIEQVSLHYIFTGDPEEAERSLVLDHLREELENKKFHIDQYFGERPVQFVIEFRSSTGKRGIVEPIFETHFDVSMSEMVLIRSPNGEELHVGMIKLLDLEKIHQTLGPKFLDSNIRYGYGEGGFVNRAISGALKSIAIDHSDSPEIFAFNHNGITLFAEKVERVGDSIRLSAPRLLNGAQTVTTTTEFLKKYKDNTKLEVGRGRLEKVKVLCKIVANAKRDFVSSVTINNNRQNPVEPWNLHANDMIQLELQEKFLETLGVYYERQENAFDQLTAEDISELGVSEESRPITLRKLTQVYLLTDGKISRLSDMVRVFEDQKIYLSVFNDRRLDADSRAILICYKIQFRLKKAIKEIQEKGANKYAFISRARNLVWALLCQGILNSPDREDHLEAYGEKMTLPADFTQLIVSIATTKVRILISELLKDPDYQLRVLDGNFSFLRTDVAFEKCMRVAQNRWRWTHRKLT